jgi:hypothetical protein
VGPVGCPSEGVVPKVTGGSTSDADEAGPDGAGSKETDPDEADPDEAEPDEAEPDEAVRDGVPVADGERGETAARLVRCCV